MGLTVDTVVWASAAVDKIAPESSSDVIRVFEGKLRYFSSEGELIPTPQESALQERLAKEQERLAKEQERLAKEQERLAKEQERLAKEKAQQRSEILAQKLRELGINPDEI